MLGTLTALLARRPTKIAAIALANKIARMAWAMMARGERYKEPAARGRTARNAEPVDPAIRTTHQGRALSNARF
jgi:hypothetical protein